MAMTLPCHGRDTGSIPVMVAYLTKVSRMMATFELGKFRQLPHIKRK